MLQRHNGTCARLHVLNRWILPPSRTYEFDGDEKWLAYLNNVEIIGTDREAAISKLKAKWYKRNIVSGTSVYMASLQNASRCFASCTSLTMTGKFFR